MEGEFRRALGVPVTLETGKCDTWRLNLEVSGGSGCGAAERRTWSEGTAPLPLAGHSQGSRGIRGSEDVMAGPPTRHRRLQRQGGPGWTRNLDYARCPCAEDETHPADLLIITVHTFPLAENNCPLLRVEHQAVFRSICGLRRSRHRAATIIGPNRVPPCRRAAPAPAVPRRAPRLAPPQPTRSSVAKWADAAGLAGLGHLVGGGAPGLGAHSP